MPKKDFVVVTDFMMRLKMGKRIPLCEYEADSLAEGLKELFERVVEVPRVNRGKRQTLDSLIGEETLLLARHLRDEEETWLPRITRLGTIPSEDDSRFQREDHGHTK